MGAVILATWTGWGFCARLRRRGSWIKAIFFLGASPPEEEGSVPRPTRSCSDKRFGSNLSAMFWANLGKRVRFRREIRLMAEEWRLVFWSLGM